MASHRATLIQCIREYVGFIEPYINNVLINNKISFNSNKREIIKWIIEEELELVNQVFSYGHIHNHAFFSHVHEELRRVFPMNFSMMTKHYIKAPILYADNINIILEINDDDLYIKYFSNLQKPF